MSPELPDYLTGKIIFGVLPFSRGSTGRTTANNLTEQLAMKEAQSQAAFGGKLLENIKLGDSRWPSGTFGWQKFSIHHNKIEIHFVRNKVTKNVDDFKFKLP